VNNPDVEAPNPGSKPWDKLWTYP